MLCSVLLTCCSVCDLARSAAALAGDTLLLLLLLLQERCCLLTLSQTAQLTTTQPSNAHFNNYSTAHSAMASELQKLSDPNYAISLAVGPPFPDLKPQKPGSGLVLTNQCSSEPRRWDIVMIPGIFIVVC
jgi:hypothetical protein